MTAVNIIRQSDRVQMITDDLGGVPASYRDSIHGTEVTKARPALTVKCLGVPHLPMAIAVRGITPHLTDLAVASIADFWRHL